jgi:hypothetical protein
MEAPRCSFCQEALKSSANGAGLWTCSNDDCSQAGQDFTLDEIDSQLEARFLRATRPTIN